MKVTVDQAGIKDITAWAAQVIPAKPDCLERTWMLLAADGGVLTAAACDTQAAMRWSAPAQVDEPGRAVVPAKLLAGVIGNFPAGLTEITADAASLTAAAVRGPARVTLELPVADTYPEPWEMPAASGTVRAADLAAVLRGTAQAAVSPGSAKPGTDEAKALAGLVVVHAEPGPDAIELAATDRYTLASAVLPWTPAGPDIPVKAEIPAWLLARAAKLTASETVTVGFTADDSGAVTTVGLAAGSQEIIIRCFGVDYPAGWRTYASAPRDRRGTLEVNGRELADAVRRLASIGASAVILSLDECEVRLSCPAGYGKNATGQDAVPAAWSGEEPCDLEFEVGMLLATLDTFPGPAVFAVSRAGGGVPPVFVHSVLDDDDANAPFLAHMIKPKRPAPMAHAA